MPKIVSRNVVSQSKEDTTDHTAGLTIHYCLCVSLLPPPLRLNS